MSRSDRSNVRLAVLANTRVGALRHGRRLGYGNREILPLTQRADLYLLYGYGPPAGNVTLAFDVVPGTFVRPWHAEDLEHHVRYGRLRRVRTHLIVGTLTLAGVPHEFTDGTPTRSGEPNEA